MNDNFDKNVIDFSRAKADEKKKKNARRKIWTIVLLVGAAILLFVGILIFIQVREVFLDKDFWQSFQAAQLHSVLL